MLPEQMLNDVAYNAQPDYAKAVLTALAAQYQGYNNGNLSLTVKEGQALGVSQKWKLYAGLNLLKKADLIECTRQGLLTKGTKLCSLYAVTWRGIDASPDGVTYDSSTRVCPIPGHAWARWVKPSDWSKTVRAVQRANQGKGARVTQPDWTKTIRKVADSVSTTGVQGRSITGVHVEAKIGQPRVYQETAITVQPVIDSSKTLVPDATEPRPDDTDTSSRLAKPCSPAVIEAARPKIAPKTSIGNAPVTRTADDGTKQDNLAKAASLVRRMPSMSNADVARRYGLSSADVQQMRNH